MAEGTNFDMEEEFAELDFNSERLEKRFRRTMKTLAKQPGQSIWACAANRAESKAIYNMLGNERFDNAEILREHQAATIKRIAGERVILAVQDTTSLNYDTHEKTEGIGYISDKTKEGHRTFGPHPQLYRGQPRRIGVWRIGSDALQPTASERRYDDGGSKKEPPDRRKRKQPEFAKRTQAGYDGECLPEYTR
jgi:hypothetical protein